MRAFSLRSSATRSSAPSNSVFQTDTAPETGNPGIRFEKYAGIGESSTTTSISRPLKTEYSSLLDSESMITVAVPSVLTCSSAVVPRRTATRLGRSEVPASSPALRTVERKTSRWGSGLSECGRASSTALPGMPIRASAATKSADSTSTIRPRSSKVTRSNGRIADVTTASRDS